jgi:hypothetical protein
MARALDGTCREIQGGEVMKKKIRKLIYNYVFKRVAAWREGRIKDQELTDALYTYCDTNLKEAKICGEHPRFGCATEMKINDEMDDVSGLENKEL